MNKFSNINKLHTQEDIDDYFLELLDNKSLIFTSSDEENDYLNIRYKINDKYNLIKSIEVFNEFAILISSIKSILTRWKLQFSFNFINNGYFLIIKQEVPIKTLDFKFDDNFNHRYGVGKEIIEFSDEKLDIIYTFYYNISNNILSELKSYIYFALNSVVLPNKLGKRYKAYEDEFFVNELDSKDIKKLKLLITNDNIRNMKEYFTQMMDTKNIPFKFSKIYNEVQEDYEGEGYVYNLLFVFEFLI